MRSNGMSDAIKALFLANYDAGSKRRRQPGKPWFLRQSPYLPHLHLQSAYWNPPFPTLTPRSLTLRRPLYYLPSRSHNNNQLLQIPKKLMYMFQNNDHRPLHSLLLQPRRCKCTFRNSASHWNRTSISLQMVYTRSSSTAAQRNELRIVYWELLLSG
jgi:hypothetical protein